MNLHEIKLRQIEPGARVRILFDGFGLKGVTGTVREHAYGLTWTVDLDRRPTEWRHDFVKIDARSLELL